MTWRFDHGMTIPVACHLQNNRAKLPPLHAVETLCSMGQCAGIVADPADLAFDRCSKGDFR